MLPPFSNRRKQQPQQQVLWMPTPEVRSNCRVVEEVFIGSRDGQTPSDHNGLWDLLDLLNLPAPPRSTVKKVAGNSEDQDNDKKSKFPMIYCVGCVIISSNHYFIDGRQAKHCHGSE